MCEEFLEVARRGALTVLYEMHLPVASKTIPVVQTTECDGRSLEAGRGRKGLIYRYEARNVRFEVATDDHGNTPSPAHGSSSRDAVCDHSRI